jgi:AbiV family abortive infection protein
VSPDVSAPDLTVNHLRLLAPAAAGNARDLLAEAEILLERQRWPRAYALAVLAGEEAAKAFRCMCVVMIGAPKVSRHDLGRDHIGKLAVARVMTDLLFPLMRAEQEPPVSVAAATARLERAARQDDKSKQRGLYVDVGLDGLLQQPSDISEAEARNAISSVADLVAVAEFMTSDEMMRTIANPPAERAAEVADLMRRASEAYERGGDDAVMTVLTDQIRVNRARYAQSGS